MWRTRRAWERGVRWLIACSREVRDANAANAWEQHIADLESLFLSIRQKSICYLHALAITWIIGFWSSCWSVDVCYSVYKHTGSSAIHAWRFIQMQTKRRKRANEMPAQSALFWSPHILCSFCYVCICHHLPCCCIDAFVLILVCPLTSSQILWTALTLPSPSSPPPPPPPKVDQACTRRKLAGENQIHQQDWTHRWPLQWSFVTGKEPLHTISQFSSSQLGEHWLILTGLLQLKSANSLIDAIQVNWPIVLYQCCFS